MSRHYSWIRTVSSKFIEFQLMKVDLKVEKGKCKNESQNVLMYSDQSSWNATLRDRLFSTAPILKKTDFLWSKNEVVLLYVKRLFSFKTLHTVKHQSNGRSLEANEFTILSERILFIQKFVKYLYEACPEKDFIFFVMSYSLKQSQGLFLNNSNS